MLDALIEKLDAKLITAGGGIILAMALSYTLYTILTNDLSHLNESIRENGKVQDERQKETNQVLRENAQVLQGLKTIIEIKIK